MQLKIIPLRLMDKEEYVSVNNSWGISRREDVWGNGVRAPGFLISALDGGD
jgi:hypothetical protein